MNSMQHHSTSFFEIPRSLWKNRDLIWQLTRRDVIGRYRGSIFGIAWSFFNPVLMLVIYTFVFSVVFKARWGTAAHESKADFAIILFVGMIAHGLFAECVNRAPGLILSNVNYVKKVIFPLEILPGVALGSAVFHSGVSSLVLIFAQFLVNQNVPWTTILFPLVVLPLVIATMGFAWFLAALGVYIRDIGQMTTIFTMVLMFISPVFYPVSALPERFQIWIMLNPLTFIIEQSRNVLIFCQMINWFGWCVYLIASLMISWTGFWWFQKTRKGFADVL